jgi:hypothetical protein
VPGAAWDRPWIACDSSGSVYVAGKMPMTVFGHPGADVIGVTTSADRGTTFSFPKLLLPAPEKSFLNVVADFLIAPGDRPVLALQIFPPESVHDVMPAGNYSILFPGRAAEPLPGPAFHVYGHAREGKSLYSLLGARMAVDAWNGSRKGWLYLSWLDAIDGFYRVMAAASADGGVTWSKPIRLSDQHSPTDESTPAIAVNGEGTVGISWYDRRADLSDGCYQPFFAASTDGAATFSKSLLVDSRPTCPLTPGRDPITSEYRFKNGGDTQGLVGLPGAGFHLAWIRSGDKEMQLWSTTVVAHGAPPAAGR